MSRALTPAQMAQVASMRRPMPDDFPANAAVMTYAQMEAHYKTGPRTITRWKREYEGTTGVAVMSRPFRPVPRDFAEVAPTITCSAGQVLWNAGQSTVMRWAAMTGISFTKHVLRQVPDDFATLAPKMWMTQAMAKWKCGREIIRRWCKESGVSIMAGVYVKPKSAGVGHKVALNMDTRSTSIYTEAADCLRRDGWFISRRNAEGHFDPHGGYWKVGAKPLMTSDELFALALDRSKTMCRPEFDWLRPKVAA